MSRLISRYETSDVRPFAGRGGPAGGGGGQQPKAIGAKTYVDLLLKMIPAEIVTLYLFAIKLVPLIGNKSLHAGFTWGAFGLGLLLTPIALMVEEPKPNDPKWRLAWGSRIGLATGAFPLWAYATTGEHLTGLPYDNAIALIMVAAYAVVAGIIAKAVAPK